MYNICSFALFFCYTIYKVKKNSMVYVDNSSDNSFYIKNDLCKKYDITPISKRSINTITYCKVTKDDLDYIEEKSQNENPILKRK